MLHIGCNLERRGVELWFQVEEGREQEFAVRVEWRNLRLSGMDKFEIEWDGRIWD